MKPAFLTTSFLEKQQNSGISNAIYLVIKYLYEKKGIKSRVFAPVQQWGKKNADREFVSIERFSSSRLFNFDFSLSAKKIIKKSYEKNVFDIIHSYHFGFFPATIGFEFARERNLPHFFTTAYHPPNTAIKKKLIYIYNLTQGKRILSGSDVVMPFNKNEKRQLSCYSRGNYRIIPCPVNNDIFFPRKDKFHRKTITYIGSMLPWKGPQIALDIFEGISKERKDVDFILIGKGPMLQYIRNRAKGRIRVVSPESSEKVSEILAMSEVVVCPTKYESFGSAIAESMMCGTPVVSTNVGAVPETIGPGGIISEYGDWNAMKKNIEFLIDNEKERKRLSNMGIKYSSDYEYRKVGRSIYNEYKNGLNQGKFLQ